MRLALAIPLVLASLSGLAADASAARRIALVAVTPDGAAGVDAVEKIRAALPEAYVDVDDEGLRAALSAPLAEEDTEAGRLTKARSFLEQARAVRAEPDTALDLLRQAVALLRHTTPSTDAATLLGELHLEEALVAVARKDDKRAAEAFRVAARLGTTTVPKDASKAAKKAHQKALAEKVAESTLSMASEPVGAEVWLDGAKVGVTPLELTTTVGDHVVWMVASGRAPGGQTVVVEGERTHVALVLQTQTDEERAHAIRGRLLGPDTDDRAWDVAALEIAELTEADVVVLVRGDPVTAAVHDGHTFGAWGSAEPAVVVAALPVALDVSPDTSLTLVPRVKEGEAPPPRWYRTRWGVAALIAGGILVTGVTIMLVSP